MGEAKSNSTNFVYRIRAKKLISAHNSNQKFKLENFLQVIFPQLLTKIQCFSTVE